MEMEMELASQMEWRNAVLSRSMDCFYIHFSRPLSRDHNPITNEKGEEGRRRIDYSFDGLQSRCRCADRHLRRTGYTKKVHFHFLALRLTRYFGMPKWIYEGNDNFDEENRGWISSDSGHGEHPGLQIDSPPHDHMSTYYTRIWA